jgi:hypothetical protein
MIHSVKTILPCVVVYDCKHDCENLVELIETESNRPWSYIPFITGWSDADNTTSQFASLEPILESKQESLKQIGDLYKKCNHLLEDCLRDYIVHYDLPTSEDGGSFLYKVTGHHRYSTPITSADNFFVISAMMALTEATIKLERFNMEFTVAAGDVYILPAQFPHEQVIQGTPDSVYVAGKYLKGR